MINASRNTFISTEPNANRIACGVCVATENGSALVTEIGTARGRDPADVAKLADTYGRSGRAVVVVESPKASPKIPPIEQT